MSAAKLTGRIGYLMLPATDIQKSADFYEAAFGWTIRRRSDGRLAFDDPNGSVSGTWVLGRPPATTPGLLLYIMVDSVVATSAAIIAAGGAIVAPLGVDPGETTAWFSDPAGNVLGIGEDR